MVAIHSIVASISALSLLWSFIVLATSYGQNQTEWLWFGGSASYLIASILLMLWPKGNNSRIILAPYFCPLIILLLYTVVTSVF